MTSGTVLVGGGTGFVGSHVCRLFKSKGYRVTIISRTPGPGRLTWDDLENFGLPGDTVAVVNLAGHNVMDYISRWTTELKKKIWNSRVETTATMARAIIKASDKPDAFITISNVGIYKPHYKKIYTEEWRGEKFDFLSALCHEWEKSARLPGHISTRQITIRSGVVLGRRGGLIKSLYLPFYLGLGGPLGSGRQYLPWIHVNDLARLILFAAEGDNVSGIINGVAPHKIRNKDFAKAFAKAMSRPALLSIPECVLNMIFSEERAQMLTRGQLVSTRRAPTLGFEFVYPNIDMACEAVVRPPGMTI